MISINFGDLAQRARRAFRLVGRLPLSLDETVIPVALVASLDQDPYRTEPRTFSWIFTITGSAVVVGQVTVENPAGSNMIVLVYGFDLNATAATKANIFLARAAVLPQGAGTSQRVLLNANQSNLNDTGVSATHFALTTPGGVTGRGIMQFVLQPNVPVQWRWPNPVVLFPGDFLGMATDQVVASIVSTVHGAEFVQTSP